VADLELHSVQQGDGNGVEVAADKGILAGGDSAVDGVLSNGTPSTEIEQASVATGSAVPRIDRRTSKVFLGFMV